MDQQEPVFNGNLALSQKTLYELCLMLFIVGLILLVIIFLVRKLIPMPVTISNP